MKKESFRHDRGTPQPGPSRTGGTVGVIVLILIGAPIGGAIYGGIIGALLDQGAPVPVALFTGALGLAIGGLIVGPICAVWYFRFSGRPRPHHPGAAALVADGGSAPVPAAVGARGPDDTGMGRALLIIVAALSLPIVILGIGRGIEERRRILPSAEATTTVQLSPEHPVAIVDSSVSLEGGLRQRGFFRSGGEPIATGGGATPELEVVVMELGADGFGPAERWETEIPEACTDCTLQFRTIITLLEPAAGPVDVVVQHRFDWAPGGAGPVYADEVPTPTITSSPVEMATRRVVSNVVAESTRWDPERPFDARLITVDIDPGLIPPRGVDAWPAFHHAALNVTYNDPESDRIIDISPHQIQLSPADGDCPSRECSRFSYGLLLSPSHITRVEEPLDFEFRVVHWVDYFDGAEPDGTIRLDATGIAPGAWHEVHRSFQTTLGSDEIHEVEVEVDPGTAPSGALRSGVATITIDVPNSVDVVPNSALLNRGQGRYTLRLDRCGEDRPCLLGFSARGPAGWTLNWDVDAFVGYYGASTAPAGAHIAISEARLSVHD